MGFAGIHVAEIQHGVVFLPQEFMEILIFLKISPYNYSSLLLILGMTCAGGGAVAFPVMTLAFSVDPSIARDFSLMIQSCGMTAASFTIFFMKVKLEWVALGLGALTSLAGVIFGLHVIDPLLDASVKKMTFVSLWFAFSFVLYLLNRDPDRKVYDKIPFLRPWKIVVLLLSGFVGGIFSAWAGSGLDLCVFSVTTTLFRLSEKIATPTSVVLMGLNAVEAFFWRAVVMNEVDDTAWEFFGACVPIVVVGAPLGSLLGSHLHRQFLAFSLYIVTVASIIGAFCVVEQTPTTIILSISVMLVSCLLFGLLTHAGKILLDYYDEENEDDIACIYKRPKTIGLALKLEQRKYANDYKNCVSQF